MLLVIEPHVELTLDLLDSLPPAIQRFQLSGTMKLTLRVNWKRDVQRQLTSSQKLNRKMVSQTYADDYSSMSSLLMHGRHSCKQSSLSPLIGTVAQHSIDVIDAWALIGEPRYGHPQCIVEPIYQEHQVSRLGRGLALNKEHLHHFLLAWCSAGDHLAIVYRYPCKCSATSNPPRLQWSKGAYGVGSSNTTITRMDPYGFGPY